jgi:hypothetical protein
MSAAAATPAPITRSGRLLDLVRRLIDYGKELAASLQRRAAVDHPHAFGTADIALILARITCGLHRATALEARLIHRAARLDAAPRQRAPSQRVPRATPPDIDRAASLAQLPTPEQIAAKVRRQPIGAVIADICRDLGIMPCHPLWRELSQLIIRHGGSLANLVSDILDRAWPIPATAPAAPSPPLPPSPALACTGPP